MENFVTTLGDLLNICETAIPYYREMAEDNGMSGDMDSFEYFEKEAENLEKLLKTMRQQLELGKYFSLYSFVIWLNSLENKKVKEILLNALDTIKKHDEHMIKKLQEQVDFCNKFLDCPDLR